MIDKADTYKNLKVIDNYLGHLISRSKKCDACMLKHHNNICFFASSCFPNYDFFTEKDNSDMKETIEKAFGKKEGDEK